MKKERNNPKTKQQNEQRITVNITENTDIWKEIPKGVFETLKEHVKHTSLLSFQRSYFVLRRRYKIIFVKNPTWLINKKKHTPPPKIDKRKKQPREIAMDLPIIDES